MKNIDELIEESPINSGYPVASEDGVFEVFVGTSQVYKPSDVFVKEIFTLPDGTTISKPTISISEGFSYETF